MSRAWVVNASPMIVLAKVGQLRLLGDAILPESVARELLAGPEGDAARTAVESPWGQRRRALEMPESIVEWGLGAGESEVLAICLEEVGATAVLDDAAARTAARALGIPLIGTLGVVIRAKRLGLLESATAVMSDVRAAGLYLDEAVVRAALSQVGE